MSHSDPDSQVPVNDPGRVVLGQTLDLLAPIRRHRMSMAELSWHRQQKVLKTLRERLEVMEQERQLLHEAHRQSRIELREQHANRPLSISEMNTWLAREQQSIRRIEDDERTYKALEQEYRQQSQWVEGSRLEMRRRQREMEKLDYLIDLAQEAS
ncbi:hypothetical protein AB7M29_004848 [Pseudomonas sp. F-14 TE3623]